MIISNSLIEEFNKLAELKSELKPHQQRVVDKLQRPDQPGLIVAHGLGSGKTLTSIAAQDKLKMPSTVIVPAALKANYEKERTKHLIGHKQPIDIDSMQNMAMKNKLKPNPMLIVDEAHRMRDPASKSFHVLKKNKAEKRMLLTGSPFYNHPADIAPLLNVASGDNVVPLAKQDFEHRYIEEQKVYPSLFHRMMGIEPGVKPMLNKRRSQELRGIFDKWVDYHPGSTEGFPDVERQDVNVDMSPEQQKIYDTILQKAPLWVSMKVKAGLPPSKKESKELNAFLTGARQVSNSTSPYIDEGVEASHPKIDKAFAEFKKQLDANQRMKGVVYSNYLDAGINPYKALLEKEHIPYGEFTGEMNKSKRDQLVKDYNEDKLKALLLSSAGGEGLDLKGTRLIQILEPHWNDEKIKQVEGRGIRYMSHADLPPEERKVLVQRYLATRPQSFLNKMHITNPDHSVDQYLTQMSKDKEDLINQFKGLFKVYKQEPAKQTGADGPSARGNVK